jgi:hypothetical protein
MIVGEAEALHMKLITMNSILPRLSIPVGAGFALAIAITTATSAFAGRQVHGGDVARLLMGRAFHIECVDGTQGRGQINQNGQINVSYRRPSDPREERDAAMMRVKGVEICLAWKQFGGGGDGCYPVSEEAQGRFRLNQGPLWCDISPNFR